MLGDNITLHDAEDSTSTYNAASKKLTLPNGLQLTYGQINYLAGDFYGTKDPICMGATAADRTKRFVAAFDTLGTKISAKAEAEQLVKDVQSEVDAVNQALNQKQDVSTIYDKLADQTFQFIKDTWNRPNGEGYAGLALNNFDHFGNDARVAYNTGHAVALQTAASGKLVLAYAQNAFADHFLEDSFSAGHLRVPRRFLHGAGNLDPGNKCAQYMHNEDSAIGLSVSNPAGDTWICYGDKRLLDKDDIFNKVRCKAAVQASADEVYQAFINRKMPEKVGKAWEHAPTVESACDISRQELSPLFTPDGQLRNNIIDRKDKGHHAVPKVLGFPIPLTIWFTDIAADCALSGLWNAPIKM